jgi:ABC-type transporter Mla subunit MlaD
MGSVKSAVQSVVVGLGVVLVTPVIQPGAVAAFAQTFRYEDARDVIGKTQRDLEQAATFLENNHKERDRLRNAQKHLSELDRHFAKGKFDKDTLDSAIGDIQSVLDHNVLHSRDRDVLMRDVTDLRAIRAQRG